MQFAFVTRKHAAAIVGDTVYNIDNLVARGLITLSDAQKNQDEGWRVYSFAQVTRLYAMFQLRNLGLRYDLAKKLIDNGGTVHDRHTTIHVNLNEMQRTVKDRWINVTELEPERKLEEAKQRRKKEMEEKYGGV